MRADSILLSVLRIPHQISNIEAVGVYALPYKFFEVILVLPTFLMNSIYPLMLRKCEEGTQSFSLFFKKILISMGLAGLLVSFISFTIVLSFVSPDLINSVFGKEFLDSKFILLILSGGLIFFFLTQPLSWYLVIKGKQKILPIIYLVASLFNITLNVFLIPIYGYFASSVITISSELLILCLLIYYASKYKEAR